MSHSLLKLSLLFRCRVNVHFSATHHYFSTTLPPPPSSPSAEAVFKEYGFSPSQINTIFSRYHILARSDPHKILKPKLDFLSNNGISGQKLIAFISRHPIILHRSLDRVIVPCIKFLRNFVRSDKELFDDILIGRRGASVVFKFTEFTEVNVESLRKHDVPYENIKKLLMLSPSTLSRESSEFNGLLKEIDEMGFDRNSMMFIHGVYSLAAMKREKWGAKLEGLKKLGLSEDQIKVFILKQPKVMMSSMEHITKAFMFFRNELGWSIEDILKYPTALAISMENRILPRAEVLKVLVTKGLVKKTHKGLFLVREDVFLQKYILNYLKEAPELLGIYEKCRIQ